MFKLAVIVLMMTSLQAFAGCCSTPTGGVCCQDRCAQFCKQEDSIKTNVLLAKITSLKKKSEAKVL